MCRLKIDLNSVAQISGDSYKLDIVLSSISNISALLNHNLGNVPKKDGLSIGASKVLNLGGLKLCWEKDLAQDVPEDNSEKLCASWYCCSRE